MAGLYSLINFYFDTGLRYWEIVQSLSHIGGISINLSTSLRLRLFWRKAHSDVIYIAGFLQEQLDTYDILHTYKMMHLKCIQAGYVVMVPTSQSHRHIAEVCRSFMCWNVIQYCHHIGGEKNSTNRKKKILQKNWKKLFQKTKIIIKKK